MRLLALLVSIIAHACFWNCESGGYTHNSLAAFRAAGEAGFWGCEFDLNYTSDGEVFVFHDGTVGGIMFNDNPASAFSQCRLKNGEPVPRFEQFLEAAQDYPQMKLVIEMKFCKTVEMEERFVDTVIEKLREAGMLNVCRVMFISFSQHICSALVERLPGFDVQFIHYGIPLGQIVPIGVSGHDIFNDAAIRNPALVEQAHRVGLEVNVWTEDDENKIRTLVERGVDYITTNRPDLATRIVSELTL